MENTITVIINKFVDYENLTEINFCEQELRYDLIKIKNIIKMWRESNFFKFNFFEFRKILVHIAKKNWSKMKCNIVKSKNEIKNFDSKIYLFSDDDDLYNPLLSKINIPENCDLVFWNPCTYAATKVYNKDNDFTQPYFDFSSRRDLFTNNYFFTRSGMEKIINENISSSKQADKLKKNIKLKCIKLQENYNLGIKTVASISSLLNIKNILEIKKIHEKIKKIEIPDRIKWAENEINEIENLYYKNLISNIKIF